MRTRALSTTVFGIIAGVMAGAGLLSNAATVLPASMVDVVSFMRVPANIHRAERRFIDNQHYDVFDKGIDSEGETEDAAEAVAPEETADCKTAKSVAKDMKAAHEELFPRDAATRRALNAAVDVIVKLHCKDGSATETPRPAARRDNDCERFGEGSPRYVTCVNFEERGQSYNGF
jgi:hypothetical protein